MGTHESLLAENGLYAEIYNAQFEKYNEGVMDDYIPTDDEIAASLAKCPKF